MKNKDNQKLDILRHSVSHVLALAVMEMFPEAKLAIGPSTKDGFYYDFDLPRTLIPEDLVLLEAKMKKIIKANYPFEKSVISAKKAGGLFAQAGQNYKVELIKDLKKNEGAKEVSLYKSGALVDLCSGPHLDSTGEIKTDAFRLTKISGAYWRGNEKNKMLQRIYGTAFANKKELTQHLKIIEEAGKRDHRKLGKELDLFCFSDLVGPGLPLYTPKGTVLKEELQKHIEGVCRQYGFQKVSAPSLAKLELFEMSGHAKKFGDELFHVTSEKKHDFVLKPVQCPHHTQIYASKTRSYKDLPIRYMESDKQYRAEKTGEVSGLSRVYAITVEDGHSFCRVDQVKDEIKNMVKIIKDFYSALGLWGQHWVSLSVRDYDAPEKYIGEAKDWDRCEALLQEVSDELGLEAKKMEGEAALYGPKLDFMFKDSLGREIQIPTVQIDFATPKRFGLTFVNEKGQDKTPVMVHRAILGSYERFLMLLIEHFAGAFPLWLAPVQAQILTISEKHRKYATEVTEKLKEAGLRAELNDSDETISKKIRAGETQKIPYLLVVGDKEVKEKKVAVRQRGQGDLGQIPLKKFIVQLLREIENEV
ncbi:MAG: threonine--tRNA ligase [Candidatus Portnoybacteria bacterium CG10_big_fil_rev_8_21_14_0_10_44_7]|uniref:Threonine--tRNA ligase n=1 Tax=Candidatus Portnoybacteria bacterium CG10_big_fil_rev_8_21_14_0_10_44_7 TaxID=1974816 RepID=A0A2M8KIX2_9BACT|nr:MAG: threonine--tRNA ligase [Candidatus Portnoybacteria bacterium CG10_big_fil_rev_8_21_14_0_10_44_7]